MNVNKANHLFLMTMIIKTNKYIKSVHFPKNAMKKQKRFFERLQFYIHPTLAKRIVRDAKKSGKTFSEYIRDIVAPHSVAYNSNREKKINGTRPKSRN